MNYEWAMANYSSDYVNYSYTGSYGKTVCQVHAINLFC